jgi:hypothetical protein
VLPWYDPFLFGGRLLEFLAGTDEDPEAELVRLEDYLDFGMDVTLRYDTIRYVETLTLGFATVIHSKTGELGRRNCRLTP